MDIEEAKQIFSRFDGFYFHMDRELPRDQLIAIREIVTPEMESAWIEELTIEKLRTLSEAGNQSVIYFLRGHSDYRFLNELLTVGPIGVFRQQCAFLENLLQYVDECDQGGYAPSLIDTALRTIISEAERIRRRVRAKKSIERVEEIVADAKARLAARQAT